MITEIKTIYEENLRTVWSFVRPIQNQIHRPNLIFFKVGIQRPLIVLKAEAAFFYCQYSAAKGNFEEKRTVDGKQFLTADLGGKLKAFGVWWKQS